MIEVKFQGLGGQGLVIAAKLLADAGAKGGYQTQSFAAYGGARRGEKVESFFRISEEKLTIHSKAYEPDYIVLAEESLAQNPESVSGLKETGALFINSPKPSESYSALGNFRIYAIDANRIARENGVVLPSGMPVINTTLTGAIAGLIPLLDMEQLAEAIKRGGIPRPEKNIKAAQEAYDIIKSQQTTSDTDRKAVAEAEETGITVQNEQYPVFDRDKMPRCNRCLICYIFCPDLAITFKTDPFYLSINRALCKQCGICIEECPRKAITWEDGL